MILRELFAKFGFKLDESSVAKVDGAIEKSKGGLTSIAERAQKVGGSLTTFVTLPIVGIGAAALKAASDSEEAFSKFATVFGDVSAESEKVANNLAQNFGLSSTKARELLGDTGDLLSGFGFTGESALDLSKQVNELAVDLASFTNFSGGAEGASAALTKALLGEREGVKSLGISILEADVKAKVLENTQKGLTFETERQAKAYATLQLAQAQSKNAIGDYARTNQGFANQMRLLGSRLNDLAVSFGKILIPPAQKALKVIMRVVNFFQNLNERAKTIIVVVLGIAAVLGPLILLISTVVLGVGSLIGAFTGLAAAVGVTNIGLLFLIGKFLLIGLAIAAAAAIIFLVFDDIFAYFNGESSVLGLIINEVDAFITSIGDKFNELPGVVQGALALILTPLRFFIAQIRGVITAVKSISSGKGVLDSLKKGFGTFTEGISFSNATGNGIGGLLGFGPSDSTATAGAAGGNSTTVTAPIEVNVPTGTPPEEVAGAAKAGIMESLTSLFEDTREQVASPIAE
jgi:hypothetical protein